MSSIYEINAANGNEISREKAIVRTSLIGIIANVFLAAFKAVVGLTTHSIAIVLDAVNNISDAGSSLITIVGTKLAGKEPDFDYDRFFRQYASIWRTITSPEAEYDKLLKDQHPLNYLRTNVTLQQYDEFYEEYGINEGDGMYLAPDERVAVW